MLIYLYVKLVCESNDSTNLMQAPSSCVKARYGKLLSRILPSYDGVMTGTSSHRRAFLLSAMHEGLGCCITMRVET